MEYLTTFKRRQRFTCKIVPILKKITFVASCFLYEMKKNSVDVLFGIFYAVFTDKIIYSTPLSIKWYNYFYQQSMIIHFFYISNNFLVSLFKWRKTCFGNTLKSNFSYKYCGHYNNLSQYYFHYCFEQQSKLVRNN